MIQWSRPNLSVEKVRAWAKDMAITWAIGLDAADESGMGVMALQFDGSANYVIDKKGALRASIASDKLEEWVKKLLAE